MKIINKKITQSRPTMTSWTRKLVLSSALLAAVGMSQMANAGVAVVVAAGSSVPEMSQSEVRSLFLGKSKTFANGAPAVPVYQDESSAVYSEFSDKVLGKSAAQLTQYWARLVFSGKGNPPKGINGDAAVKAHVKANAGAVGYIDSAAVDGSVRVLFKAD